MGESNSAWETASVVKKKRSRKRAVLVTLTVVLVVVGLVVVFLPKIASPIARSLIASKGSAAVAGTVDARGLSLSWFGPQRVTGLTLLDPAGERVADVDVVVEAGLAGLVFGSRDLGTITIGGRLDLVEDDAGQLNLMRAVETGPSTGGGGGGGGLPASLHAIVTVENLDVSYAGPTLLARGVKSLAAESVSGRAEIQPGTDLVATLSARISGRETGGDKFESGSVSASGTVAGLIGSDGVIHADAATVTATVKTEDLDPSLADRLVDAPVAFGRAFASRIRAKVDVSGSVSAPAGAFEIASTNVNGGGAFGLQGKALVSTKPMELTIAAAALEAVDKAWLAEKTGGALDVRAMPSIGLRVEGVQLPTDGSSLASASATATVDLGAMDTVVAMGEGEERTTRRITTAPAKLTLGTESLGEGAKIGGSLAFTVDGREGGTLGIDMSATGLLDEAGQLQTAELPVLRGTVGLDGVDTGVLQPFVAAAGVNLDKEIGPALSLGVDFDAQGGGQITLITGRVASTNLNGGLNLVLEGTRLSAGDPGGQIRVASVGPLLTRMFGDRGLSVREGARVELTLATLGVDLSGPMNGGGLSLEAIDGSGEFVLGPTSGEVLVENKARSFSIEQVGAFVEMAGSRGIVQARMVTGGMFDGKPAGQVAVELRLTDLVGPGGAIGLPSAIAGRAEFVGISMAAAEAFLGEGAPRPTDLVGPTVDLVVVASPTLDGKTKLVTTLTSALLTGDGAFLFSEKALEVDPEEGYTLTHAGLARAINAVADPGEGVRVSGENSTATVNISRLVVPRDEQTRGMLLGQTDLAGRFEVRGLLVETGAAGESIDVRSIVVNPRLRPGEAASVRIAPTVYSGSDKLAGEGTFTIAGLMAALGGTGAWDLGSLKPTGSIAFDTVPAGLLAQGLAMAKLDGVDTGALARDIAGDTFALTLGVRPEGEAVRAEVKATGTRLTLTANAVYGAALQSAAVDGEVKLSQPSTVGLMRAFLPDMAETVSVVGTTAFRVNGSVDAGGALVAGARVPSMTLRGLDVADLRVGLEASATGKMPEAGVTSAMALKATTTIEDAGTRARIGSLTADLKRGGDAGLSGIVQADGLRTAWADRLLGTTDLYAGLLGDAVGFRGELTQAGETTGISATLQVPNLRETSALAARMTGGSIVLDKPFAANWRGDKAWLNGRLARSLGDQAPKFDKDLDVVLRLRGLSLPSATAGKDVPLVIDAIARIDELDMTMPGGETRAYRQVQVVARQNEAATGVSVTARGDVRIAGGEPVRAIDLTADIHDVFGGTAASPKTAYADVSGKIEHVPTSLVDALAGSGGWLTRMLGDEVSVDRIAVKRAPLEGGTVALDLSSPASSAKIAGSFKDAKADGVLEDGFFVLDQGGYIELTKFEESFTKDLFNVVPIFGSFNRDPEADRPSRIEIRSGRVPMSGGVEDIAFDLSADLGSVQYGLSGPIQDVLKATGQNAFGQVGARIQPFDVSMAKGIVSYDKLTVPLGEFAFMSRGDIDVVKQVKDLVVLMPAGTFAVDAFNLAGPLAGALDKAAVIPLTNAGALSNKQWKPDFAGAIKPGKALEEAGKQGIKQILKNRLGGGGGEAGGGSGGGG